MHVAARSYLSTGVALVGAGAVAISPVAPPLPDVKVPTPSTIGVEMSAAVNPIQTWVEVLGTAVENLAILGQIVAENPAPILQQVIENQLANIETLAPPTETFVRGLLTALSPTNPDGIPANLREAFELIVTGNPAEGFPAIFQAFLQPILFPALEVLIPVQGIITQTAQNVLDVANQTLLLVAGAGLGLLSPVASGFSALGAATQAVVDAANDGDPLGVLAAVLDIPGVVTGGVLNGFGFDGGILTPMSGTIAALLTLRDTIAQALAPNPPAAGILSEGTATTAEEAGTTVTFDITAEGVTPAASRTEASGTSESPEPGSGGSASLTDEDAGDEVVDPAPEDEAPEDEAPEDEAPEVGAPEDEAPEDDAAAEDEAADDAAAEDEATEQEPSDDADANDTDDNGSVDTGDTGTGSDDTGGAEA